MEKDKIDDRFQEFQSGQLSGLPKIEIMKIREEIKTLKDKAAKISEEL